VPAWVWPNAANLSPIPFNSLENQQGKRNMTAHVDHIGVDSKPPRISPARGPPLWDDCDAQRDDGVHIEPDWDLAAQPTPDYEVDQRINW
jgi:hypothetical protein